MDTLSIFIILLEIIAVLFFGGYWIVKVGEKHGMSEKDESDDV